MTALTDNRDTPERVTQRGHATDWTVLNAEIMYAGGMAARDYADEVQMASDTAGLVVVGRVQKKVDNTLDGETCKVENGVFRYGNSSTSPVPLSAIGQVCYVEDDQTVAGDATNYVPAGIVVDVDSDGVWVDQRPEALAQVRYAAPPARVSATANVSPSAAVAMQGRSWYDVVGSGGAVTVTLPSAVAGMRVGVQRGNATAGKDVYVTAASGDKVLGGSAAGSVVHAGDAVSDILWLRAVDDTNWREDPQQPAKDVDSWAAV